METIFSQTPPNIIPEERGRSRIHGSTARQDTGILWPWFCIRWLFWTGARQVNRFAKKSPNTIGRVRITTASKLPIAMPEAPLGLYWGPVQPQEFPGRVPTTQFQCFAMQCRKPHLVGIGAQYNPRSSQYYWKFARYHNLNASPCDAEGAFMVA